MSRRSASWKIPVSCIWECKTVDKLRRSNVTQGWCWKRRNEELRQMSLLLLLVIRHKVLFVPREKSQLNLSVWPALFYFSLLTTLCLILCTDASAASAFVGTIFLPKFIWTTQLYPTWNILHHLMDFCIYLQELILYFHPTEYSTLFIWYAM